MTMSAFSGSHGSLRIGMFLRPMSPLYTNVRLLPFSVNSACTIAEPSTWPASFRVTTTPGTISNGSSYEMPTKCRMMAWTSSSV